MKNINKIFKYGEYINNILNISESKKKVHFSKYNTNSRSVNIEHLYSENDIEDLLNDYASYFLKAENIDTTIGNSKLMPIYRGIDRTDKILLINPKKYNRVSRNTENYYTLIIDNNTKNSDYPKRSKSIICSTSDYRSSTYGKTYRVIPLNENENIGICNNLDIWNSFTKGVDYINDKLDFILKYTNYYNGINSGDLNDLNRFLKYNFNLNDVESFGSLKDKLTVDNFIKNIDIDIEDEDDKLLLDEISSKLYEISDNGNLYYIFENALNYSYNNFKLLSFKDTNRKDYSSEVEVWLDSESLLIDNDIFEKWMRKKFYIPKTDKYGWKIVNGLSTDPRLQNYEERRQRVEDSK